MTPFERRIHERNALLHEEANEVGKRARIASPIEYGRNEEFTVFLDGVTHLFDVHAYYHVSSIETTDVGDEIYGWPVVEVWHEAAYDNGMDEIKPDKETTRLLEIYLKELIEHQLK